MMSWTNTAHQGTSGQLFFTSLTLSSPSSSQGQTNLSKTRHQTIFSTSHVETGPPSTMSLSGLMSITASQKHLSPAMASKKQYKVTWSLLKRSSAFQERPSVPSDQVRETEVRRWVWHQWHHWQWQGKITVLKDSVLHRVFRVFSVH